MSDDASPAEFRSYWEKLGQYVKDTGDRRVYDGVLTADFEEPDMRMVVRLAEAFNVAPSVMANLAPIEIEPMREILESTDAG